MVLNAFLECMRLAETCIWRTSCIYDAIYPFDGDRRFSKILVYFWHIPSNVENIPEFLVYFGLLVTLLVSFAKFLDIRHWLLRNTEIFRQTHGLNWHHVCSDYQRQKKETDLISLLMRPSFPTFSSSSPQKIN